MMNQARIARVIALMRDEGLPCILVSDTESVYYLTGQWITPGERMVALLLWQDGRCVLVANRLFALSGQTDAPLTEYDDTDDCVSVLSEALGGIDALGVDKRWPSQFLIRLMEKRPSLKIRLGSVPVDLARMRKDASELEAMCRCSLLNDAVLGELITTLREGDTETEAAERYAQIAKAKGADGCSFSPLICFGPNGASPHHSSDGTRLKKGDAVICDVGVRTGRALSDMTRTVFFGEPTEEQRRVYRLVREANMAGKAAVRPGVTMAEIDAAARHVIDAAGYGAYFIHRTGHGIGLSVHEPPDVSASCDTVAQEGMVFSIEPGIYLPGKFGVRIEDLVCVTKNGCEVLNHLPVAEY